jgi:hypothetical protein
VVQSSKGFLLFTAQASQDFEVATSSGLNPSTCDFTTDE